MIRILYGPTASGKSSLALEWAIKNAGTIINADALQVYNALPILTAQPDASDKAKAPHELYGTENPLAPVSAAYWAHQAAETIKACPNPILVGGTGLYIKTLLEGIAPIPDTDPKIRAATEEMYLNLGAVRFQEELEKIDPASADRIEPNNRQRMIRAMEVFTATGRNLTDWYREPKKMFLAPDLPVQLIVFLPYKEWIRERALHRARIMLKNGALEEVREFGQTHGTHNPAAKALGFAPLWAHAMGQMNISEAKDQLVQDTNAYIKRQLTWGRTQMGKMDKAIMASETKDVENIFLS